MLFSGYYRCAHINNLPVSARYIIIDLSVVISDQDMGILQLILARIDE